jgi:tRNA pseudouridine55 synthase
MKQTKESARNSPDGVVIIDKPAGMTSHDIVDRARKIFKTRRVGHTGTLDPFATGVLVLCLNRGTRLSQYLMGQEKEYLATMRLGFSTDTGDYTGSPATITGDARSITRQQIEELLPEFKGFLNQTPPMFSAKKVGGVKLYEMARRGREIPREPIRIEIKELELCGDPVLAGETWVDVPFQVVCSSGTYIRTLAQDIGERLGLGAHLTSLRRTRAGSFSLAKAATIEQLESASQPADAILSLAAAAPFPSVELSHDDCKAITHGRSIDRRGYQQSEPVVALVDKSGELIAIANFVTEEPIWRPIVVFRGPEEFPVGIPDEFKDEFKTV